MGCHKDSKTFHALETHDPSTTLREYFGAMRLSRASACAIGCAVPFLILFFPLFLEAAILILALGAFIPLGFFIGLIEHRFIFLWAVIVLFIQLGGVLDLFADISLVAKFFIYYFDLTVGIKNNPNDKEIEDGLETFTLIRFVLTLAGPLVSLLFLYMLSSTFGTLLDTISGKKFWVKDDKKKNFCSGGTSPVLALLMLLVIMIWKLVLMAFRVHMLYSVAKSLFTKGRLEQRVQWKVQWIEIILLFDLLWSGIPLGVLTALELFVYEDKFEFSGETVFELLKMAALAVDIVGASFLVYYVLFGLIHKVPCLHHEHHEHHEEHGHHEENSKVGKRKSVNVTDTTPLLQEKHH